MDASQRLLSEARDPILNPLDTIERREAILTPDSGELKRLPTDIYLNDGEAVVVTFRRSNVNPTSEHADTVRRLVRRLRRPVRRCHAATPPVSVSASTGSNPEGIQLRMSSARRYGSHERHVEN